MRSLFAFASSALLLAVAAAAPQEDVLHSRRMAKRDYDASGNYNISFYHINDVHAHLDEFRSSGTDCTPNATCFGGYARVKTVVDDMRPTTGDSLFLNVGDEFQGTLFYTYYGGEKIAETLNQMGFDAMTLGNHEFDGGDDELGEFLANLTFPVISANVHSSHPVLNRTIKPYHIFPEYELAVIGVTTEYTPGLSSPGNGTTFDNSIETVQATIDHILATTNITRLAAITHIGYDQDQLLAQQTSGLHLIMGGHSHTPLGNFTGAEGPYPTIVTNRDGEEVFIVTAYRWGEYLGYIDVVYGPDGRILSYHGAPIHMTQDIEQDPELQAQIDEWREPFAEFAGEVLGFTEVVLEQTTCRTQECTLGDFMADAMMEYRRSAGSGADFALINSGGIRATIDEGNITRGEVLTSFPFGNSIVEFDYSGDLVWSLLEGVVSQRNQQSQEIVTSFIQVSRELRVTYDPAAAVGSRLVSVEVGGAPLDRAATYTLVTLDFLASGGGDNIFEPHIEDLATLDLQDEVLVMYIESQSPVNIQLDGRLATVGA